MRQFVLRPLQHTSHVNSKVMLHTLGYNMQLVCHSSAYAQHYALH